MGYNHCRLCGKNTLKELKQNRGQNMKIYTLFLIAGFTMSGLAESSDAPAEANDVITLTIMYDNYTYDKSLRAEWGFSCLIEGTEQTVLFDTGGDANVLEANFRKLKIDPNKIDTVVISHMHWDHINGLEWLIKENGHLKIFMPDSAPEKTVKELQSKAESVILVSQMQCICGGVFSTGTLQQNVPEQSLCVETPEGIVVITGCSHPGIVRILKKAKELSNKEICLAFGGFHLGGYTREQVEKIIKEIKSLGVEKIGPTHCTGDLAIAMFKEAWGQNYVPMGVGRQLQLRLDRSICTEQQAAKSG
jgi:7,8-dihydropterin-6-yl-methyl-4-(beta-D-ribofuranosyl)aminobenzene 5'-phosphate synthase